MPTTMTSLPSRPILSYSDIATSGTSSNKTPDSTVASVSEPPTKRRKPSNSDKKWQNNRGGNSGHHQNQSRRQPHWDDASESVPTAEMSYGDNEESDGGDVGNAEEGNGTALHTDASSSRKRKRFNIPLNQEDIWDDSALINAWDSAVEEYEALHGPEKSWKQDPVKKSALWYHIPPQKVLEDEDDEDDDEHEAEYNEEVEDTEDSMPFDFSTYVPSYDPSLPAPTDPSYPYVASGLPPAPSGPPLTKDQAFERAVGAAYWAGYWAAVYHNSSGSSAEPALALEDAAVNGDAAPSGSGEQHT